MGLRTRLLLAVAVIAVCGAVAGWYLIRRAPGDEVFASGTIEVIQSDLSPKVEGRLVDLRVNDGDAVKKGEVVAVLERVVPTLSLEQELAQVASAQQQVDVAQSRLGQAGENLGIASSSTVLAIDQAQAQLASAQSAYELASTNLVRARSLVGTGDEPRQTLDDARNAYTASVAQLKAARDAVALAQADRRSVAVNELEVRASRLQRLQAVAALAQARASFGLARNSVEETQLVAPYEGYVISHNFEDGSLIQPGAAVITVGDLEHPYVYVYVSETDLPRIKTGMKAEVSIDGLPGRTFVGTVTEIGTSAEFTPENVQTKEERIEYLVFRIKIQFVDETGTLKPGLPVDAVIHV